MLFIELTTIVGAIVIPVFHEQQKSLATSEIFSVGLNFTGVIGFSFAAAVFVLAPFLMNTVAGGFSRGNTRDGGVSAAPAFPEYFF